MAGVLTEQEKTRFEDVSRVYLSFIGEDFELLLSTLPKGELYVSTATDLLKALLLPSIAKAKGKSEKAAVQLGQLLEETANIDLKKRESFEFLLSGLEKITRERTVFL